jgi:DNA replication protein DnaC
MIGTEQPASIGEVFEKIRGAIPGFREWRGSEAERAMNAEAEEYLDSIGIVPSGNWYSASDVLNVKRREAICAECRGMAEDVSVCRARGYKTLLRQYAGKITGFAVPCEAKAAIDRQEAAERLISALPSKLSEKSFENFRIGDVSESVREAYSRTLKSAETGESLVLAGGVGTGKTHLAAALLIRAIRAGKHGLFRSVPSLMNRLRSFGPKGDYQNVLDDAIRYDTLVFDDLGAERCTDWVGEQLYMLIDERYTSNRQTVVTTNFQTPEELITHLEPERLRRDSYYASENYTGQRIVSRLCEMGAWIVMSGADRRIRRARKPRLL